MSRGRKSKYDTVILPNIENIKKWRNQGYTEAQICKELCISVGTWEQYKSQGKLELIEVLKASNAGLIEQLEASLFKKAMGGYTTKKTKKVYKLGELVEEIEEDVEHGPDTSASIFALKNLSSKKWQDKRQVDTVVSTEQKELMESISDLTKELKDETK